MGKKEFFFKKMKMKENGWMGENGEGTRKAAANTLIYN
jgi:hypothetical protein